MGRRTIDNPAPTRTSTTTQLSTWEPPYGYAQPASCVKIKDAASQTHPPDPAEDRNWQATASLTTTGAAPPPEGHHHTTQFWTTWCQNWKYPEQKKAAQSSN